MAAKAGYFGRWMPRFMTTQLRLLQHWKTISVHCLLWCVLTITTIATFTTTYYCFYNWYIPDERVAQPLYFDYTAPRPEAIARIPLRKGLVYDLSLNVVVPDMAGLSESLGPVVFHGKFGEGSTALNTVRPLLVVYRSWPVRLALLALRLVPVVLGFGREATAHRLFLAERFAVSGIIDDPSKLAVKVEMAGRLPTYEVTLEAVAHFTGLRYLMYYWKWSFGLLVVGGTSLAIILTFSIILGLSLYANLKTTAISNGGTRVWGMSSKSTISSSNNGNNGENGGTDFTGTVNTNEVDGGHYRMKTGSTTSLANSIRLPPAGGSGLKSGWGLASLRRRLHTTDEMRVPNGRISETSDNES